MNRSQRAISAIQRFLLLMCVLAISACNEGPKVSQPTSALATPDLTANALGVFKVENEDNQPVSDALFVLKVAQDPSITLGKSNSLGNFSSQVFPRGKQATLTITKDGHVAYEILYDAIPDLDELTLQTVKLISDNPISAVSSGSFLIKDQQGNDIGGAAINMIVGAQPLVVLGNSDENGLLKFDEFPNGTAVKISVSKSGYLDNTLEFTVPEMPQVIAAKTIILTLDVPATTTSSASFFIQDPQAIAVTSASLTLNVDGEEPLRLGTTNAQGFLSSNKFPNGKDVSIAVSKSGYANQIIQFSVPSDSEQLNPQTVTLLKRVAAKSFDGSVDSQVTGDDGAFVAVKANAFENAQGETITSEIKLHITPVDVSNESAEQGAFPGSFSGVTEDDETVNIVTYGTTEFVFTDDDGNELQLKDGETADILLPIYLTKHLDGTLIKAGDKIPLWHLDETTGIWIQEGEGDVVASNTSPSGWALSGKVSHFTWWNVDVAPPEQDEGLTFDLNLDTDLDNDYRVTYRVAPLNGRASTAEDSFIVANDEANAGTISKSYPVYMNIQLIVDIYIDRLQEDSESYIPVYRDTRSIRVPRNIPKTITIDVTDQATTAAVNLIDDDARESTPSVDGSIKMFAGKFNKVKFLDTKNFVVCPSCSTQNDIKITVLNSDISEGQWQNLKLKFDYEQRHFSILGELEYREQPYSMTLVVSDGFNNEVTTQPITIKVIDTPTLTLSSDTIALKVGDKLSWQDIVINQGRAPFKLFIDAISDTAQLSSAIDNIVFSEQGLLVGNASAPLSDLTMTFYVIDANGFKSPSSQPLTINIEAVGVAPSFENESATIPLKLAQQWQSSSVLSGSAVTSYNIEGSLPRGLTLNSQSGVISGIIDVVGQFEFKLIANNDFGQASKTYSLDVAIPTFTQGSAWQFSLNDYTQGAQQPWDLAGALPTGISFDVNTGEFSGTSFDVGSHTLTVTQPTGLTVTLTLVIQSADNQAPIVSSLTPTSITHGETTPLIIEAADPEGGDLTYVVTLESPIDGISIVNGNTTTPSIEVALSVVAQTAVAVNVKATDRFGIDTNRVFTLNTAQQPVNTGYQAAHLPTLEPFRIKQLADTCYLVGGRDNDLFKLDVATKWQRVVNVGSEEINQFSITDIAETSSGDLLWAGENRLNNAGAGLGKVSDDGSLTHFANLPVIDNTTHASFSTLVTNGSTVIAAGHNQILYSANDGDTWLRSDMTAGDNALIGSEHQSFTIFDGLFADDNFILVGEVSDVSNEFNRLAGYLIISSNDGGATWKRLITDVETITNDSDRFGEGSLNTPPKFSAQRVGQVYKRSMVHNGRLNAVEFDSVSGQYIAVGSAQFQGYTDGTVMPIQNAVYVSDDGVEWTKAELQIRQPTDDELHFDYLTRAGLSSVVRHPTLGWLATDNTVENGAGLLSSADGSSWVTQQANLPLNTIGRCDTSLSNRWIAAGANGNELLITSDDITVTNNQSGLVIQSTFITNNNTTFIAFGVETPALQSVVLRSIDSGQNWTRHPLQIINMQPEDRIVPRNVVKINDNSWLAIGQDYFHSTDTINWTKVAAPNQINGNFAFLHQSFASNNKVHLIQESAVENEGNQYFYRSSSNGSIWSAPQQIDLGEFSSSDALNFSDNSLQPWRVVRAEKADSISHYTANEVDNWQLTSEFVCSNSAECDNAISQVRAVSLSTSELLSMQYTTTVDEPSDNNCFSSSLKFWQKQPDETWLSTITDLAMLTRNQGCNDELPSQLSLVHHDNGNLLELKTEQGKNSYFSNNKTQWHSYSFSSFHLQHVTYSATAVVGVVDTADSDQYLFKHSAILNDIPHHQIVVTEPK